MWTQSHPSSPASGLNDEAIGVIEAGGSTFVAGTRMNSSTSSFVRVVSYANVNGSLQDEKDWPAASETMFYTRKMAVYALPNLEYTRVYVAGELFITGSYRRVFVLAFEENYDSRKMELVWSKVIDDEADTAERQGDDFLVGMEATENYVAVAINRKGAGRDFRGVALSTNTGGVAFAGTWAGTGNVDDVPVGVVLYDQGTTAGTSSIYVGGTTTMDGQLRYKIVGWDNSSPSQVVADIGPAGPSGNDTQARAMCGRPNWSTNFQYVSAPVVLACSTNSTSIGTSDTDYYAIANDIVSGLDLSQRWDRRLTRTGIDIPTAVMSLTFATGAEPAQEASKV
ncbi:MAG: hypothetical protein ACKVW3_08265 [Phycisphaerales bacterium]